MKDIGVHGFPCFCLLVDFVFNVYQFPFRHLLVVLGVAIIYLFINLGIFILKQDIRLKHILYTLLLIGNR